MDPGGRRVPSFHTIDCDYSKDTPWYPRACYKLFGSTGPSRALARPIAQLFGIAHGSRAEGSHHRLGMSATLASSAASATNAGGTINAPPTRPSSSASCETPGATVALLDTPLNDQLFGSPATGNNHLERIGQHEL